MHTFCPPSHPLNHVCPSSQLSHTLPTPLEAMSVHAHGPAGAFPAGAFPVADKLSIRCLILLHHVHLCLPTFSRLRPPLGLGAGASSKDVLRFVFDLDIPLMNGRVPFHRTSYELVRRCCGTDFPEGLLKEQVRWCS